MDHSIRSFRLSITMCLIALAALPCIQFLTHVLHVPPIPSRLFYFCLAACCLTILGELWLISRRKRKALQADAPHPAAPEDTLRNSAKILGLFALELAFACAVVAVIFHTPFRRILSDYFLFLAPFLVGMPLILHARQFRDRPKLFAVYTACGFAILVILLELAMLYSGLMTWLVPGMVSSDFIIFSMIFVTAIAVMSALLYFRLTSQKA